MGQQESTAVQRYRHDNHNADDRAHFVMHNPEVHVYNGGESSRNQHVHTGTHTTIYSSATQARQVRLLQQENQEMEIENDRILKAKERKEADLLKKEAELSMYKQIAKQAIQKEMLAKKETEFKLKEKDELIELQKQKLAENKEITAIALEYVVERAVNKTLEENPIKAFNHQYKFNQQSSSGVKSKFQNMKIDNKNNSETRPKNNNVGQMVNEKRPTKNEIQNQAAADIRNANQFKNNTNAVSDNRRIRKKPLSQPLPNVICPYIGQEPASNNTNNQGHLAHNRKSGYQNVQNHTNAMSDNMRMRNNMPLSLSQPLPKDINYPHIGQQFNHQKSTRNSNQGAAHNDYRNVQHNTNALLHKNVPMTNNTPFFEPFPHPLQNGNYHQFGHQQPFSGNFQSSNFTSPPTNFNQSNMPMPINQQTSRISYSMQFSNRRNFNKNTKRYENNASNNNYGKMNRKTAGNDAKKEQNQSNDSAADSATNTKNEQKNDDVNDSVADGACNEVKSARRRRRYTSSHTRKTNNAKTHVNLCSDNDAEAQKSNTIDKNPREKMSGQVKNSTENDAKNGETNDDTSSVADGAKNKWIATCGDKTNKTQTDMNLNSDNSAAGVTNIVNKNAGDKMVGQFQCPICSNSWIKVYNGASQQCHRCKVDVAPIRLMPKKEGRDGRGGEKRTTEKRAQNLKEDIDTLMM